MILGVPGDEPQLSSSMTSMTSVSFLGLLSSCVMGSCFSFSFPRLFLCLSVRTLLTSPSLTFSLTLAHKYMHLACSFLLCCLLLESYPLYLRMGGSGRHLPLCQQRLGATGMAFGDLGKVPIEPHFLYPSTCSALGSLNHSEPSRISSVDSDPRVL